jgi:hypothetical protein
LESPPITNLPERVAALSAEARARIERLFFIDRVTGVCDIPEPMTGWVRQQFGDIDAVRNQTIVRVVNRVTYEGALYNPLRGRRPLQMRPQSGAQTAASEEDIFATPLTHTASDGFGRVRGAHGVTTSNISRWDGQCAVTIFDDPDPRNVTREHMRDYFRIAMSWARLARTQEPEARYFVWMWNGGLKAGASIPHAHAQMALGRGMHYAKIEQLRAAACAYGAQHGANYFDDWLAAHRDLGLVFQAATLPAFCNLAAVRNKDIAIIGTAIDDALADAAADVLRALIDRGGTGAFNVVLQAPPLFPGAPEDWNGFPVIARICDRGAPAMVSSDIGALDLYAHSTVPTDPFGLAGMMAERAEGS